MSCGSALWNHPLRLLSTSSTFQSLGESTFTVKTTRTARVTLFVAMFVPSFWPIGCLSMCYRSVTAASATRSGSGDPKNTHLAVSRGKRSVVLWFYFDDHASQIYPAACTDASCGAFTRLCRGLGLRKSCARARSATQSLMDAPTKAIIETIGGAGFDVQLHAKDGLHIVEAIVRETGEAFIVRGDDLYRAVVELAEQCGIDLMDG